MAKSPGIAIKVRPDLSIFRETTVEELFDAIDPDHAPDYVWTICEKVLDKYVLISRD